MSESNKSTVIGIAGGLLFLAAGVTMDLGATWTAIAFYIDGAIALAVAGASASL